MADLVTVPQIKISLGRDLTSAESQQAVQWIDDTLIQIRKRLGDPSLLDQAALSYVVREAVVLKLKRPDPASKTTISVDDGQVAKEYQRDTGTITILDEWWTLLTPDVERNHAAFTVRPGRARGDRGPSWCP